MSRRVTTKTEIKDKALAIDALKLAGMSYRDEGDSLLITSGAIANARINLTTGEVSGDSDYRGHSAEGLGALRQYYGEAKYTWEAQRRGITITNRSVERNGDIVLMCRMA
jgi:hypothetical protein